MTTDARLQPLVASLATEPPPAAADPDLAYLTEAQAGDTTAFRHLVERYQHPVLRLCHHTLGCALDAQEVCQDAFVKAWLALPDYQHTGHFQAWLFRIALNHCRDRLRSAHRRKQRLTDRLDGTSGESFVCTLPTPDTQIALLGEIDKLQRGLALLPERLRLPLILCGLEQLSQQECSHVLGISVRAVEGRLHRARRQLMQWWDAES